MPGNPQSPSEGGWQAVLDGAVPAIVALQVTAVRSFQDDLAGAHGGTGFVVDAGRGLLLTNRHVCTCGPERATATFVGCPAMEEARVEIAYVDPVHDFAFLHFDPQELRQTPRAEIPLDPTGLRVGEEIRVVGNDSLEKLQILSGTIARIDRNPPELSSDYHDENTFYALAGSGTRGGSSGSPVLNCHGRAVGLNAAATGGTMHAFYLPLHRVQRALEAVRRGTPVPRGSLCAAFACCSLPECARLGVEPEFLRRAVLESEPPLGGTFSKQHPPGGLLQVKRCVPATAAAASLLPGDVLLELGGKPCVDFVLLDAVLDAAVGRSVQLALCRGGQRVELELEVQDLHSLVPHAFLELGLGIFHQVPYQTAQRHHVPLQGIYVAQAGFVLGEAVKTDGVILEINGGACHDLAAFEEALRRVPNGEYFSVTWMTPKGAQERRRCEGLAKMQRHWSTFRAWSLDRATRRWSWRRPDAGPAAAPQRHEEEAAADMPAPDATESDVTPAKKRARRNGLSGARAALGRSICTVVFRTVQNFDTDLVLDSENQDGDTICCRGAGIVVDADAGLVLTDRVTVPQPLGDIEVTLGSVSRSASVWFLHPLHSLAVLRLDPPAGGGRAPFGEAAAFEDHSFEAGDEPEFVGVDTHGKIFASRVKVRDVRLTSFPSYWPPRWHERNLEAVILSENPTAVYSGVLCDEKGHVRALYSVASVVEDEQPTNRLGYGIPAHALLPLVQRLRGLGSIAATAPPAVPSLELEFRSAELAKLRRLPAHLRPPRQWLARLASAGGTALQVAGVMARGPCDGLAREGDLLVALQGRPVASAQAVEAALGEAAAQGAAPVEVQLTLLRRGREVQVSIAVPSLGSDGARRVLCWQGLLLQDTPRAVLECGPAPAGVYISQTMLGSPGEASGIEGEFLCAVDGRATPSLEAVIALDGRSGGVVAEGPDEEPGSRRHLRVESMDMNGRRFLKTLEPDPLFWPTFEMSQDQRGGWSCKEYCA